MLPGLLLKGKHLCHVTINERWDVRESISDGIHGRRVAFGYPTPISIYYEISRDRGCTWV